jgi:hypothetical protein
MSAILLETSRAKKRGGRASRDKGNRLERAIVRLLQDHGLGAERVPLATRPFSGKLGQLGQTGHMSQLSQLSQESLAINGAGKFRSIGRPIDWANAQLSRTYCQPFSRLSGCVNGD